MKALILMTTFVFSTLSFAGGMSEIHYKTGSGVKQVISDEFSGTEIEVGKMKFSKNPPANCTVMVESEAKFKNVDGDEDQKDCSTCFEKAGNGVMVELYTTCQ